MATAQNSNLSETAIVWVKGGNTALVAHLLKTAPFTCPVCHTPAGYLYHDADSPEGACLSCKIDDDVLAVREAEIDEAFWAEAQLRETALLEEDGLTREEWHAELASEYQAAAR